MNDLSQLQDKYFPPQDQMIPGPSSSTGDSSMPTPSPYPFVTPYLGHPPPLDAVGLPQQSQASSSSSMPPPAIGSATAGAGPIRRRRFSTAKIQPTRIKKVMQADEEIGRMVASVPVAIGRAMEHFAEKFLQAAAMATTSVNSRTVTPVHMKKAMLSNPHFHFLAPVLKEIGLPGKPGGGVTAATPSTTTASTPPVQFDPSEMSLRAHLQMAAQNQAMFAAGSLPPVSPLPSPATPTTPSSFVTAAMSQMHLPYHPLLPGNLSLPIQSGAVPQAMAGVSADTVAALSSMVPPTTAAAAVDAVAAPAAGKRTNGGKRDLPEGEKPKRGRPRKVKKDERCLDEELCKEVTNGIEKEDKADKDRALMPPPALPMGLGRANAKPVA